jgi:N-acetyl-anhydromuramyl-L-alanine amidase AmpD
MGKNRMLKLTKPYIENSMVRRIQEHLDILGYSILTDGVFGPQTDKAIRAFQASYGLKQDGICGPATENKLLYAVSTVEPSQLSLIPNVYDFRGDHPRPKLYGCKRTWDDITGVVLHQTGCKMPTSPSGWKRLNAHIGITSTGQCVIVNDPTDMIWHAQRLSPSTIGIEIAGNFAGVEGRKSTVWKGGGAQAHLTDAMLEGLDMAFDWVNSQFTDNLKEWLYVYAHRQSSAMRRADPGSEIWQCVGMDWIQRLGASDGEPGFAVGKGLPIPREWDDSRQNYKY